MIDIISLHSNRNHTWSSDKHATPQLVALLCDSSINCHHCHDIIGIESKLVVQNCSMHVFVIFHNSFCYLVACMRQSSMQGDGVANGGEAMKQVAIYALASG
jgi:hypothetical protein